MAPIDGARSFPFDGLRDGFDIGLAIETVETSYQPDGVSESNSTSQRPTRAYAVRSQPGAKALYRGSVLDPR